MTNNEPITRLKEVFLDELNKLYALRIEGGLGKSVHNKSIALNEDSKIRKQNTNHYHNSSKDSSASSAFGTYKVKDEYCSVTGEQNSGMKAQKESDEEKISERLCKLKRAFAELLESDSRDDIPTEDYFRIYKYLTKNISLEERKLAKIKK